MPTKVHRIVLLVVDTDDIGDNDVRAVLENTHYPNRCISPQVMKIDTREVEWSDEHPLNKRDTQRKAFNDLFGHDVTLPSTGFVTSGNGGHGGSR